MKVTYDPEADAMYITLRDAPVDNTDELQDGIMADYDAAGHIIGLEILDASKNVSNLGRVEFCVLGAEEPAGV